jgi:hypothetical protein
MIAWPEGGPKATAEKVSWWWPEMPTETAARIVVRRAAWCAIWVAALNALFASISAITGTAFGPFDAMAYVDATIMAVIAVGLWRGWRAAAVSSVIYYSVALCYTMWSSLSTSGHTTFPYVGIVFIVAFVNGIRGTFALNQFSTFAENT